MTPLEDKYCKHVQHSNQDSLDLYFIVKLVHVSRPPPFFFDVVPFSTTKCLPTVSSVLDSGLCSLRSHFEFWQDGTVCIFLFVSEDRRASVTSSAHSEILSGFCRDFTLPLCRVPSAARGIRSAGHYPPAAANDVGSCCKTT